MSNVSEAASWLMWHLVTHSAHGYSQPNRLGNGAKENVSIPGWGIVTIAGGDRDCSSACIGIYRDLGINVGHATYTGNERQGLTSTGLFTAYRAGSVTPRDGDILLRSGHTEMVVNGGREQAGFRRSEHHSITGATGDQDGQESTHSPLAIGSWTWVIRYTGPDKAGHGSTEPAQPNPEPKPAQPKPTASTKVPAGTYRVLVDSLNVRTGPNVGYRAVAQYSKGETVRLDGYSEVNSDYVWGRYTSYSGKKRYVAVRTTGGTAYAEKVD